ncbi:hypothetical protein ACFY3B_24030 [Micromonospora parva]|uniref:Uncharacterized protein n=1 Tax=Micromonospora parva TaxID=1464048 RepID=A0ABW6VYU8_9ACTN
MATSEAVTLLIAVVGAGTAIVAALFAGSQAVAATHQARYAQEQLNLAEQVRKDQAQPYVFADLRPDEQEPVKVMLVIQNTGSTVAKNVRVKFDPPLSSVAMPEFADEMEVLNRPIAAIPPGRALKWFFDISFQLFGAPDAPRRYNVTINADGPFGPVEELIYDIDLSDIGRSDAAAPLGKKIADELEKARKALEKLAKGNRSAPNLPHWITHPPPPGPEPEPEGDAEPPQG